MESQYRKIENGTKTKRQMHGETSKMQSIILEKLLETASNSLNPCQPTKPIFWNAKVFKIILSTFRT